LKGKKIAVLMGGMSAEREISIKSGKAVEKALKDKGYNAVAIDVGKDIDKVLKDEKIEAAFIAMHGRYGEDGVIQGVLESLGIPYTGSGVMSSAMAMDKAFTKKVLVMRNIRTPDFDVIEKGESLKEVNYPVIVKPVNEGSTIGISIVKDADKMEEAVKTAFEYDDTVLIEAYIKGREFTVSVLNGEALPVLEVKPKSGFYDFESKYNKGMTEYIVPAEIDEGLASEMQSMALDSYKALDCKGVARVDFMADSESTPYVIEVNTVPGMTELSLLPMAAGAVGISYEELVEKIIKPALAG